MFPVFDTLKQCLPILEKYIENFNRNKDLWKEKIEFYDKELCIYYIFKNSISISN